MVIEIKSGDILTTDQLTKHMKIYAGPGAGKTHFLVENIKNIIKTNEIIAKSKTRRILCITYTNAAVDEIKRRIDKYADAVEICTIHGFIIEHIITPFQQDLKKIILEDFDIEVGKNIKITSQIEGLGILHGHEKEDIYDFINNENSTSQEFEYSKKVMGDVQVDINQYCNSGKTSLIAPSKVEENHKLPIKKYTWTKARKLTHDEILYFGYRILMENSTATYALRVKFPFVFVDEFQDTNPLQTLLIKHLGEKSTVLGIIGDVAQSIYSFQGAKPTQFLEFETLGERELVEYNIIGNRRSTENIVSLSNFLRKSDSLSQKSVKTYNNESQKSKTESQKISFIIGETPTSKALIDQILQSDGVVLTRSWAAAFAYIQNISEEQVKALKAIYNGYYNSPIDIRSEIAEHNNVAWVRAFKFIIMLWEAQTTGSFVDLLNAFSLYNKIDNINKQEVFSVLNIIKIKSMLNELFSDFDITTYTVDIISKFNDLVTSDGYKPIFEKVFDSDTFMLQCFSEFDKDNLIQNISKLEWNTAYKLFKEVFSANSKYMTVHQAKGLEWDKVIVSLIPGRYDNTSLESLYSSPQILQETESEEFTRMYYVACSRAKEELYIHLPDDAKLVSLIQCKLDSFKNETHHKLEYDFIR